VLLFIVRQYHALVGTKRSFACGLSASCLVQIIEQVSPRRFCHSCIKYWPISKIIYQYSLE